jgi:N-acetylmuramic acid 6-phosphate (MurNAc-6-P) etherase
LLELEGENAAPRVPEEAPHLSIEDLLAGSAAPGAAPRAAAAAPPVVAIGMRTARLISVAGRRATLALRGAAAPVEAEIAPEVDPEIIADAGANGDSVLIELVEGETPLVVAALQTRKPREIRLRATTVHIEGDQEVLLRSGRGAVRIREDGDIEVVGSRISAASRGLFRIVGRLLRLN